MYTIAYKWRLTTNKYAYITSTAYDSSNPNYRLSYISEKLPDITEDNIKNIVKRMSADEYRQCFEFMQQIIAEDNDGKYIKLKNWGYYYHFENDENGDNKILFVDAIASASVSRDNEPHVEIANNDGVLAFHFEIPRGERGSDGIDGENGLNGNPMNDGKFSESIYKLTRNNDVPTPTLPPDWQVKGSDYQKNDYLPNGWSDTPCGISTTYKYEWVSTRKYNSVSGLWGRFSTSALMSKWGEDGRDGDGTEYIYKRTKTGEKPIIILPDNWESENSEYQTNDEFANVSFLTDQGWYDAPLGVNDEYHFEWVSFRKHRDGKWGAFSEPALWGTMGKDGNDIEFIFYLNNDNEPPVFDDGTNDPNKEEFQVNGYKPKTGNKIWFDNYQDPTYENRFLWMSSRKKINDVWGAFNTGVSLFNTYRLGGKAYVDLYTRSNTRLTSTSLPSYGNEVIYYNFNTDSFYSGGTGYNNIITTIPGNNNVIWSTDIPEDNTPRMLFKTSALVEIKDNFDEYIPITSSMWYGPYIVSTNGENAIAQTPLVVFDDDSLSLPVREETNKPHERYKYSFNANLYYGDIKLSIVDSVVSGSSSENIINIEKSINTDGEKLNIQFEIDNSNDFTSIEYIYITLKGEYDGKDIVAEGQFKIIPFYSKDAVLYKILLNQDAIFIPSNPCEGGEDTIWRTVLTAQVVDNNGTEITINWDSGDTENGLFYKYGENGFNKIPEGGLTLIACDNYENDEQIAITNLPNPLNIIYKVNGTTREIEYVNFVNMPLNGADGASSRLVFAYCSLEEGQIPTTPTGGTVDFTNNVITEYPKSTLINDETVEVEWSSGITNSNGITWLSQCEYFNYGVQDLTWTPPIRISGAKGDKGDNPYHVELSNDMDQIYVTDDVIIYPQTVMTTISLFNGDEKALLNEGYINISDNDIFESISKYNSGDTDVIITLTTNTGVTITSKTVDINLTISGEPYGKSYNFIKTFKLNVLHGTKDYDLDVYPTFIKKNKDKQYSESAITVNITERDIATHSKVVTTLTSFTEGLSITYFYNNDSDRQNDLETIGNKIPVANVEGYNDEINKITINLYKQGELIDQVFVECVSDGIDGTDGSAYHLELSNEFDQVYTINKEILPGQTGITTTVQLFNGTQSASISDLAVTNFDGISTTGVNGNVVSISFDEGAKTEEKEYVYKISGKTPEGDDVEKDFKIIVLNGNKDYDLHSTHTYVKKYGDNIIDTSITITVLESIIGTNDRSKTTLNNLPERMGIEVFVDGNIQSNIVYDSGITLNLENLNLQQKIEVKLFYEGKHIDYIAIEVIKDGVNGKDGISPYYIELSNDYDQILTTNNKVVINQAIETTLSIYCGDEIITANSENIECRYVNEDLFTVSTGNSEDNKHFTYIISAVTNAELEQNKTYDFEFIVKSGATNLNYDISKKFKVIALNGTIDYDLDVTPTLLKKTVNGYSNSAVTIAVKETDISRTDRQINILNELPEQLSVECYINETKTEHNYSSGITISSQDFPDNGNIYVKLLKSGNTIDEVTVEIISDGKDGDPGVDGTNIEFVYKLYEDENAYKNDITNFTKYSASTKNEIINSNNGWTDSPCGITKDYQIEACSQHTKEAGATGFTTWCPPFIWSKWGEDGIDGDSVEYIFQITDRDNTKPSNPGGEIKGILENYTDNTLSALTEIVNTFDFYPGENWITANTELISDISEKYGLDKEEFNGIVKSLDKNWTDDPMDVGPYEPLEWVSIRRKKVNLDGTFEYTYSEPTIWAEWKRDTYDSLTEFMFVVDSRDLSNCIVTGCTWKDIKDGSVYTGVTTISGNTVLENFIWYDSVPNNNSLIQNVWMVKGFASGEIIYTGGTIDANEKPIPTGITYSNINWTSPTKLIDSQFMQVEYSCDNSGEIPAPINLNDVASGLGANYDLTKLEEEFRKKDIAYERYDFNWTNNPTADTPTWMITSTFHNGVWSDWVVSKIKGEKGDKGETGQGVSIKGSFSTEDELKYAYYYYMQDKTDNSQTLNEEIIKYKEDNSDKLDENGKLLSPSKYFLGNELILGDSYIIDECTINGKTVNGYLFVYVFANDGYVESWEPVGHIKGDSSYIYIAYASSVTIDNYNIKTYHLTEGGTYKNDEKYYGTTPGKYIGIHVATQQYEGHPYPQNLYKESAITETDKTFLWNKWEGDDGFGQEQIFILSGETAPKVPVYDYDNSGVTGITIWNSNGYVPSDWSDNPLTPTIDKRYCWMATRRFPFNGEGANEFKGVSGYTGETAILFSYYASDGDNGESPIHVELSNDMEQIYTIDSIVNINQTASTIVTVYSGSTLITNFSVNGNNVTNGEYEYTKVYNSGFEFNDNEEKIEIKVNVNGIEITRFFKVIKLNGTVDYDLLVSTGVIKKDINDNNTPTGITVNVTKSNISATNINTEFLSGTLPDNLTIMVTKDNNNNSEEHEKFPATITTSDVTNSVVIELVDKNTNKTIDIANVEVISDGKPGANGQSPFHIELSNEFDLISVIDGKVNGDQTYTTSFELWEGDVDRTSAITSISISNIDTGLTVETGLTAFTLTFTDDYELNETIYGDLKVNTTNGKTHHRTFTIKPINENVIHQLQVNKGYVVIGQPTDIDISAFTKTSSGMVLMADNIDKKIVIKEGSETSTATTNTCNYTYTGGSNDIVINLYINDKLYDYVLIEAKNDIKPSGTLNITPISQVVYVEKIEGIENKYKPLVSSVTFDASFVYEGIEMPVSGINISVTGSSSDFSGTPVISDYGIEAIYLDTVELTTDNLTKERYVFETTYGNDTYYNNFFITYIEPQLDVWVDGDCIYIPDDCKGGLSKEFIFEAKFDGSNVTHDCKIEVEGYTGITFNLRSNCWYINIPSEVTSVNDLTGFTINFTYNGISVSKEVTIIRRGKNSENWYINVFPKYLYMENEPINLYITKNNYNGEYISLENALNQNMKLYYIIDGECVNVDENGNEIEVSGICYSNNLEYAPKEHGNNAFYPSGCLITSTITSTTEDNEEEVITITDYTQEPIYSSIEFKLYYEPDNNHKELVASEKVERFDVIRNSEPTRMPASGLKIDVKDLFKDYDSEKYDIVIKEIKK